MMNVFSINWSAFVKSLLPMALRTPRLLRWLRALISPLVALYHQFLVFRHDSLYKVRHNSQIAYMENVLNDAFDLDLRRIRIINASFKNAVFFYEPEENREVFFYEPEENKPVYFYGANELVGDGVDFYVAIPPDLQPQSQEALENFLTRLGGLINYYKLYSKNYQILWEHISD